MTPKSLVKWLIISILALVLAGCQGSAPKSEPAADPVAQQPADQPAAQPAEKPVEITFWHTYGDTETEVFTNEVLPLWSASHPNVTVNAVRQDSSQYHQMVVTSFGTGQSPDVARIDIVNTAPYAKQGGLVALDDLPGFSANDFLEGPLSTNLYQGKYYGLPLDTNCKAAVVNTAILKDALGIDSAKFTMEEFIAAAESRGQYSLNVSGVGDWDLYPYFWLFGGVLTDDGFTKASGYLDSDQSVAAINKIQELHDKKIFTIRDIDGSVDAWDGINSEYAMFIEGPWFFGAYEEKANAGIIAATVPTYNGKSASVVGGENIVVFSTSKQQDAAYEFAKFMTTPEVQLAMLKTGQLPILKSLVSHEDITSNPVWSVYMEQLSTGASARIPSPSHTEIGQIWSDTINNIFVDSKDVKTALSDAASQIDSLLK
ncbi:MAG: extracellular solute-binding protein [Clostridiales bacterium]|jgi:multiple sugar transport system substrate-binding protein|nr:extracellular solute-binding protein [Clostridiales bacterium]